MMNPHQSIPPEVLAKILAERPGLRSYVSHLSVAVTAEVARKIESAIATNYLSEEHWSLSESETAALSACRDGHPYGHKSGCAA